MIKIISCRVVGGGGFGVRLLQFTHGDLTDALDNPPRAVAAFAGLFRGLPRLLV